jgi:hypothetical protein
VQTFFGIGFQWYPIVKSRIEDEETSIDAETVDGDADLDLVDEDAEIWEQLLREFDELDQQDKERHEKLEFIFGRSERLIGFGGRNLVDLNFCSFATGRACFLDDTRWQQGNMIDVESTFPIGFSVSPSASLHSLSIP